MNEFLRQNNLFSLEEGVEKVPVEQLRKSYCENLRDWAQDDKEIRQLALKVLPEFDVNGDIWGVPHVTDIVESLVIMIECLRLEKNWDEFNKSFEK